ncbi:glycosyltransferase [Enterobacter sp. K16B]|uniref:glycosyltransferase n=1 Tax=Enterobacter sp. K16B TaxID=2878537 RepID=UPI001CD941EB|nr:glycosyltransferase [Enterobacter sp. K16B]MCA2025355.1 glycosyltransferase [Enterobacter sp. K16B]
MKIVHVITSLGLGGAERTVCDLADQQALTDNDVYLISLTGKTVTKPENNSIKIINLKCNKSAVGYFKALLGLSKILKKIAPDVVHGHMFHAIMAVRLIPVKKFVVINTFHNLCETSKIRCLLLKATNFLKDLNTCVCDEASAFYGGVTIPNGIPLDKFAFDKFGCEKIKKAYAINEGVFLFGYVGRLHKDKNVELLIEAFSHIKNTAPNSKLLIVGDGENAQHLRDYVAELNLESMVIFHGRSANITEIYSSIDLLVIPSLKEGFGLVAAESILCGTPVISMNNSGVPYVLDCPDLICNSIDDLQTKMMMFYSRNKIISVDKIAKSIEKRFSMLNIEHTYRDMYFKVKRTIR